MEVDVRQGLSQLAVRLGGEGAAVADAQRLSGGASMETWAFALTGPGGREDLILRRRSAPFDEETARSVSLRTEAALIQATAANGAKVPIVRHVCDDADGLGEAYVMRRVAGETLGKKIVSDPRFDAIRPALARQCGEALVPIHRTALPAGVSLKTADAAADLDRYEEVYRATGAQRPVLELAFQYLRKRIPEPVEPVLLHGDFRNGNIMFDPETGVAAVLDWELAHLGDPAEDMGWICTNSWRFGRPDRPVGGFGDYADLLAGYAAAGGKPIELSRVRFWQMLGSLRWGVMCLTMYLSWASGVEKSVERPMIGRRVSETEADLVVLLEQGL
ncbi:phosphotransferase family protein [Phenylobacterium kunshanense]|uniref:Phosphotransferase family protein n=1 Tax=Phenylobacterium kunshanense TaxID=1445034 RepID=A0A328BRJ9_9CAUL|nr:phosphotransferase family protein [Phenylobacterium kunshanense]RAK68474.1 phosphotransferase family protein [Phenylobacterium kunshanense]